MGYQPLGEGLELCMLSEVAAGTRAPATRFRQRTQGGLWLTMMARQWGTSVRIQAAISRLLQYFVRAVCIQYCEANPPANDNFPITFITAPAYIAYSFDISAFFGDMMT